MIALFKLGPGSDGVAVLFVAAGAGALLGLLVLVPVLVLLLALAALELLLGLLAGATDLLPAHCLIRLLQDYRRV